MNNYKKGDTLQPLTPLFLSLLLRFSAPPCTFTTHGCTIVSHRCVPTCRLVIKINEIKNQTNENQYTDLRVFSIKYLL